MNNSIPLKIVIIDDESDSLSIIRSFVKNYCPNLEIVGEAEDVISGVQVIKQTQPHLVLLDIQLGDSLGFEILEKFSQPNFRVIFITAHDNFALKAFHFNAMDYILKPLAPSSFIQAIDKAQQALQKEIMFEQQLGHFMQTIRTRDFGKLALSTSEGLVFVDPRDIFYLQSDVNYTYFFMKNGEKILVSKPLKDYDELLTDSYFFRIHQSYLVNIKKVKKVLKEDGGSVLLENGVQLPISRRKKEPFLKLLME